MSTPPPQALSPHSTPIHTGSRTIDPNNVTEFEDSDGTYRQLSDEMIPYFVGPMPPQAFLDAFLPSSPSEPSCNASGPPIAPFKKGMFSNVVGASSESDMNQKFVCSKTLLFCFLD